MGIRIKLSSTGSGQMERERGDQSKFGLNSSELLEAIDILDRRDAKDCLEAHTLPHRQPDQQDTRYQNALREATQFYVQLSKLGFGIEFIDIGGGLGVDYDGTRSSSSESSMNYSIQEYANDAVSAIVDACNKNDLPQPNVITESGRSLTAHHSILIFEVLETTQLPVWKESQEISPDDHELARELYDICNRLDTSRLLKAGTTRSRYARRRSTFSASECSTCAHAPRSRSCSGAPAREVGEIAASMKHVPEDLRKIAKMIPDKYFCNFSLFQSLPDSWAIDQIFPIVPISRL